MKILLYAGHPAQYHFYKNITADLRKKGHTVIYIIKTKDVLEQLLKNDNQDYINILPEERKSTKVSILFGLLKRDIRLFSFAKYFKPDILFGGDPCVVHIGKLLGKPAFTITEDDLNVVPELSRIAFPFATKIITPVSCDCGKWNYKQLTYNGYMKLAYLHPKYFIPSVKSPITGRYFLIRLSRLNAHHDFNIKGLNTEIVKRLISFLVGYGTVKIISESDIDIELREYLLKINPSDLHNYLYHAELLISDSQSMSMESAMLGVPSIRFSDFSGRIGVLEELEHKYGLTYGILPQNTEELFEKVKVMVCNNRLKEEFSQKRNTMLNDKIDVTEFFSWFIDQYPQSLNIIEKNPDYQFSFR